MSDRPKSQEKGGSAHHFEIMKRAPGKNAADNSGISSDGGGPLHKRIRHTFNDTQEESGQHGTSKTMKVGRPLAGRLTQKQKFDVLLRNAR